MQSILQGLRRFKRAVESAWYRLCVTMLQPLNACMALALSNVAPARSVLHLSGMVHTAYQTTRLLRNVGWQADYLAMGRSPIWNQSDFCRVARNPWIDAFNEFWWVWRVVARYRVVHLHFMITVSRCGWELPWLKRMGRRVVVHWRGCEIRDRERNMRLHPAINLCQKCDYNASICTSPLNALRRDLARRHADLELVTTPDLLDFAPRAVHLPFFAPEPPVGDIAKRRRSREFRIVHVTVHPGLEGTADIAAAVDRLRKRGYAVRYDLISWVTPADVMREFAEADLAIGKMKMGYYANAQIESLVAGVPTVTSIRPDLANPALSDSGFIFASLDTIEDTLAWCLDHPQELARKRSIARESILRVHDNRQIAARLASHYEALEARP